MAALIAWRRAQPLKGRKPKDGKPVAKVAPATVNRSTTEVLKKLFTRAKVAWRYQFPREPNWRSHWLKEPPERVRELHSTEEAALDEAMRSDYAPWFQFALLTGLRLAETIITWDKVNWGARLITTTGKGGVPVTTPITPAVAALFRAAESPSSRSRVHIHRQAHGERSWRPFSHKRPTLPYYIRRRQIRMAAPHRARRCQQLSLS